MATLEPNEGARSARVLVVDDDRSVRSVLRTLCEFEDWTVAEAADGQEALAALAEPPPPHLVLLDLMMPGIQGLDVLRRIRAEARLDDVAVVVVSAKADPLTTRLAREAGAADYVTKPFDPDTITTICQRFAPAAG